MLSIIVEQNYSENKRFTSFLSGVKTVADKRKIYLYDLTDAVDVYLPNLTSFFSEENSLGSTWRHPAVTNINNNDGKIYGIPYSQPWGSMYSYIYGEDIISSEIQPIIGEAVPSVNAYCYIRDDILKALYPNQKTVDELKADMQTWIDNGYQGLPFEEDTVFLNDIKTTEDFYNLMLRIKEEIETHDYSFAAENSNEKYKIFKSLYPALRAVFKKM